MSPWKVLFQVAIKSVDMSKSNEQSINQRIKCMHTIWYEMIWWLYVKHCSVWKKISYSLRSIMLLYHNISMNRFTYLLTKYIIQSSLHICFFKSGTTGHSKYVQCTWLSTNRKFKSLKLLIACAVYYSKKINSYC